MDISRTQPSLHRNALRASVADEGASRLAMTAGLDQRQRISARSRLERHAHRTAYAAIVLSGAYWESGDDGRTEARPGSVIIHDPFNAHANQVGRSDVVIVNVELTWRQAMSLSSGAVADPEAILRPAPNTDEIVALLRQCLSPAPDAGDLVDHLARDLRTCDVGEIGVWARTHGVNARTLRRQFRQAYHVTPAQYRWRARARRAWQAVVAKPTSLSKIAHEMGYADQAHMSRAVRQLTGQTPSDWRRGVVSV